MHLKNFTYISILKTRNLIVSCIRLYQKTISPDHGFLRYFFRHNICRFEPTCSEYAKRAILANGLLKGGWMSFCRLLRCHPYSYGGFDPPETKTT